MTKLKPIYGPVPSWRLGRSLGIDPISCKDKTCSFDCTYCQLGKTVDKTSKRKLFVDENIIEKELKRAINKVKADIVTLSGTGEPTLAKNLGKIINKIRKTTKLPIAILTNSSLIYRNDVQKDLKKADFVIAKLDAPNEELFQKINQPIEGLSFKKVFEGVRGFRKNFNGKLALQIMFVYKNKEYAPELSRLAKEIIPDEVQINTPLRLSPEKPLNEYQLKKITSKFKGLNAVSVYEAKKPNVKVLNMHEMLMRRPEL